MLVSDKGNHVLAFDGLSRSPVDVGNFLTKICDPANSTFDIMSIEKFFAQTSIETRDQIYHLASPLGPTGVLQHAGNMVRDVVRCAYLVIDHCMAHSLFSILKRSVLSVYHRLRPRNLQTYPDEFAFRFNRRKTRKAAFATLLAIAFRRKPLSNKMLI